MTDQAQPVGDMGELVERLRVKRIVMKEGHEVKRRRNPDGPEAATAIEQLRSNVERQNAVLSNARAWIFECWGWLMETDLDMTCPMENDPLDIVEQIDALLGIDPSLSNTTAGSDRTNRD